MPKHLLLSYGLKKVKTCEIVFQTSYTSLYYECCSCSNSCQHLMLLKQLQCISMLYDRQPNGSPVPPQSPLSIQLCHDFLCTLEQLKHHSWQFPLRVYGTSLHTMPTYTKAYLTLMGILLCPSSLPDDSIITLVSQPHSLPGYSTCKPKCN